MDINYGDMFVVSVSGDFYGYSFHTYAVNDFVIYVGNDLWIPLVVNAPTVGLDASSASNLPHEAAIGDMFIVHEDGNFLNSYMVRPDNDSFIQGDTVIYTGSYYVKVNEYTFEYNPNEITPLLYSKDYLNNLGFNSNFRYLFNNTTKLYEFYFDDIFNGLTIGTFRYTGSSTTTLYDVGKIIFEPYVTGNFNMKDVTAQIGLDSLFDDTTINKISFLPKNKRDLNGALTTIEEDNFDTVFNTYTIVTYDPIGIKQ
jgi:hypothetical protein